MHCLTKEKCVTDLFKCKLFKLFQLIIITNIFILFRSGLKLVFALLAHSSKNLVNDENYIKSRQQQDTDEHLCSIIKSLLQFSTGK